MLSGETCKVPQEARQFVFDMKAAMVESTSTAPALRVQKIASGRSLICTYAFHNPMNHGTDQGNHKTRSDDTLSASSTSASPMYQRLEKAPVPYRMVCVGVLSGGSRTASGKPWAQTAKKFCTANENS